MTCCDAQAALDYMDQNDTHSEDLKRAAFKVEEGVFQSDFIVTDMHCSACIKKLEDGFQDIPGVLNVRANLSLKRLSVKWVEHEISPDQIEDRFKQLGFTAMPFDLSALSSSADDRTRELLIALGVAGFSAMNIMLLSVSVWSGTDPETTQLFHLISGLIAVPAVLFAGRPFFRSAWSALRVGRLNMDVPISLAVLLALGMSIFESLTGGLEAYFDAAVSLLFFLLIGRYLDHLMRQRARYAVDQLSRLTAKGTLVLEEDGTSLYKPLSEVVPGMKLEVKAGERVPLDCRLASDHGYFDRSLVTGESATVSLTKGDEIEAGTLNLINVVELEAIRSEDQSFIAKIVKLMDAAEGGRSRYVGMADRMARIYAPAVHLLALIAFVFWMVTTGDWHQSLYTAIAVLIVTCPCALALAVPVVHVIAATRLFKSGIMMKDGNALERMAEIDTVFFDKTGTLTKPAQSTLRMIGSSDALPAAKALAFHSSHPLAQSITSGFEHATNCAGLEDIQEVSGYGMEGILNNKRVRLGRSDWVREINPEAPEALVTYAEEGGQAIAFEMDETLAEGANEALESLKTKPYQLALLSGDTQARVDLVAKQMGADEAYGALRPEVKTALIEARTNSGARVLMVGDGLNDAAALAKGHASMAPANACDVGRAAADFVFTRETLLAVPETLKVARRAASLVRQNFALALLYNCIAVPCAMLGIVTPLFAALAMSLSSIVVIANSMRLNADWALFDTAPPRTSLEISMDRRQAA